MTYQLVYWTGVVLFLWMASVFFIGAFREWGDNKPKAGAIFLFGVYLLIAVYHIFLQ